MTAQQIADEMILCGQNLVMEELMRHDESLLDSLQNFDDSSEVLEWWLVTPYMADMLKEKGEVILSDYDCYWWGRTKWTGTLHGRSDTGDSGTDGVGEITKTQRGFQLDLEIELDVSRLLNVFL